MNLDYISSENVVDRYVLGQLSEREQVEFELYFFENPDILDEVEMARALKHGLTDQQAALVPAPSVTDQQIKPSALQSVRDWFQLPVVLAGNFALIAALLVLVFVPGPAPTPASFSGDRVWIGQLRGSDTPLAIEVRATSLVLDIDVAGSGPYDVSLLDAQGHSLRHVEHLTADMDALLVVMSSAGIGDGSYSLEVKDQQGELVVQRELIISVPD